MNPLEKEEVYLFGQIVSEPVMIWKDYTDGKMLTGWNCRLHTNSSITGENTVVDVQLVYDLIKWDVVRLNSLVKLSVQQEQVSKLTSSGKLFKCNVVVRK
jgi:hypothetical protein